MAFQKCANCDREIGRLETIYLWQGHEVCLGCYNNLTLSVKSHRNGQKSREDIQYAATNDTDSRLPERQHSDHTGDGIDADSMVKGVINETSTPCIEGTTVPGPQQAMNEGEVKMESASEEEADEVQQRLNAIASKLGSNDCVSQQNGQPKRYGGIRRLGYFCGMFGVAVLSLFFDFVAHSEPRIGLFGERVAIMGAIVSVMLGILVVGKRLQNIGMSSWWLCLTLMPIANLYVGVKCLICPEGYEDTKRLDITGKIIVAVFFAILVVGVAVTYG